MEQYIIPRPKFDRNATALPMVNDAMHTKDSFGNLYGGAGSEPVVIVMDADGRSEQSQLIDLIGVERAGGDVIVWANPHREGIFEWGALSAHDNDHGSPQFYVAGHESRAFLSEFDEFKACKHVGVRVHRPDGTPARFTLRKGVPYCVALALDGHKYRAIVEATDGWDVVQPFAFENAQRIIVLGYICLAPTTPGGPDQFSFLTPRELCRSAFKDGPRAGDEQYRAHKAVALGRRHAATLDVILGGDSAIDRALASLFGGIFGGADHGR